MGFPIISEIWDGIRWFIDFVFNKFPKPLLYIIFLLSLIVFGSFISWTLQIAGIHCNSDKDAVKVTLDNSNTNFMEYISFNANLLFYEEDIILKGDNLSICQVHPQKCGRENDCYLYAKEIEFKNYEICNQTNSTPEIGCNYLLLGAGCHDCITKTITLQNKFFALFTGDWYDVCVSDALPYGRDNDSDIWSDCFGDACVVPKYYYFDMETGQYICTNLTICGTNSTYRNSRLDEMLETAGAELIYPPISNNNDYRKAIQISCSNDYKPRLTFFGIDIFDYKIWVLLTIIYVMFLGISLYKRY